MICGTRALKSARAARIPLLRSWSARSVEAREVLVRFQRVGRFFCAPPSALLRGPAVPDLALGRVGSKTGLHLVFTQFDVGSNPTQPTQNTWVASKTWIAAGSYPVSTSVRIRRDPRDESPDAAAAPGDSQIGAGSAAPPSRSFVATDLCATQIVMGATPMAGSSMSLPPSHNGSVTVP